MYLNSKYNQPSALKANWIMPKNFKLFQSNLLLILPHNASKEYVIYLKIALNNITK